MRRLLILALLLWPAVGWGQDFIRYRPPALLSTGGTLTGPLLLPDGTASAPSLSFGSDTNTGLYLIAADQLAFTIGGARRANISVTIFDVMVGQLRIGSSQEISLNAESANILGLRNSTNAQTFYIYNSFTTAGSNYGRFAIKATATGTDLVGEGAGATIASGAFRSLQGSVSKTLTDAAAAVSFVRIAVATNGYIGGKVIWTANSTDGTDRLATTGEWLFSAADTAGTVTCNAAAAAVSTPSTAYRRGNTLVCTITGATSTTNCDLQVTCTDNKAGDQTPTFEWRLDMPSAATVTPQ